MELYVLPARRLRVSERRFIADHLTRPWSDFQRVLLAGEPAGTIAICLDQGEIIGWARSEIWQGRPTLEAFVATAYRRRSIATACSAALLAASTFDRSGKPPVAVFSKRMNGICKKLAIDFDRFDLKPDGTWTPC